MKLLPLLLLASILTAPLYAQNFQIGADGGIIYSSTPKEKGEQYDNNQHRFTAYALKAMYDHRNWQYGFEASYRTNSYSGSYEQTGDLWSIIPVTLPLINYTVSQTQIPLKLLVNRKIVFSHLETYIGPFVGYTFATSQAFVSAPHEYYSPQHYSWLVGGVQMGATYFIKKRFGINIGLTGEYNAHSGSDKDEYSKYAYPVTLGLRYKL